MRELINSHIREASLRHTAPVIAERMEARAEPRTPSSERSEQREPKPVVAAAKALLSSRADPTPTGKTNGGTAVAGDPIQPLLVKTITYRTAPVQAAPLAPMPPLVAAAPLPRSPSMPLPTLPAASAPPAPAAAPAPLPTPAPVTTAAQATPVPAVEATATTTAIRPAPTPAVEAATTVIVASTEPAVIAPSTKMQTPGRSVIAKSDSARSEAPRSEAARPEAIKLEATKPEAAKPEVAKTEIAKLETAKPEAAKSELAKSESAKSDPAKPVTAKMEIVKPEPSAAQIRARGGWIIQIGAFEAKEEAKQHLSEARLKIPHILASADPFTERVQKGDKALYRARFAGFDKANAEAACKQLKRSDIACMTVKN